eukprot:Gb_03418 [translate_table: standard]
MKQQIVEMLGAAKLEVTVILTAVEHSCVVAEEHAVAKNVAADKGYWAWMALYAVFEKGDVAATVAIGYHLQGIVAAVAETADAVAVAFPLPGESCRLAVADYDWDFAIENGANCCVPGADPFPVQPGAEALALASAAVPL